MASLFMATGKFRHVLVFYVIQGGRTFRRVKGENKFEIQKQF